MQSACGKGVTYPPGASFGRSVNLSQFPGAQTGSSAPEGKVQASAHSVIQPGRAGQAFMHIYTYGGELSMQTTLAVFPEGNFCLKRQQPCF